MLKQMQRVNRLLASVKREALNAKREHEELEQAISRMTTEQLIEIAYNDPPEARLFEVFESVGGLCLLESG